MAIDLLQKYSTTATVENDIDCDFDSLGVPFMLLDWWAAHKQEYLLTFDVACVILLIPGAEVDIERLFNIARDILGLCHMSMASETLRGLIL